MRQLPEYTGKGGYVLSVAESEQDIVWKKLTIYDNIKPEIEPDFIGQQYIDIKSKKVYIAVGFTVNDWALLNK